MDKEGISNIEQRILKPAVGRLDEGLYVTCGYYDYGITMVPAVGRLLAETIASGETSPMLKPFDPLRFG